jgi:hypothetical protein
MKKTNFSKFEEYLQYVDSIPIKKEKLSIICGSKCSAGKVFGNEPMIGQGRAA